MAVRILRVGSGITLSFVIATIVVIIRVADVAQAIAFRGFAEPIPPPT